MEQEETRGNEKEFDDVVCGGVVHQFPWLERLPVTREAAGASPVAPANSPIRNYFCRRNVPARMESLGLPAQTLANLQFRAGKDIGILLHDGLGYVKTCWLRNRNNKGGAL